MNRKELGKLIAALRKENFDADGNRLTQAGLADRVLRNDAQSPLNEVIIGKIERGERAILDDRSLLNLAGALELTLGERREFFLAATGLDNQQIYADPAAPDDILASVLQMLADIRLPAILLDTYLDVIAVNAILLRLYDTTFGDLNQQRQGPDGFNLLGLLFSAYFDSQRKQMAQREWNNFAVGNVMYFRRVTLQYRMTPYFATLFAQLRRNREFRWFWEQALYEEKRYFVGGESFEMGSADSGRLSYLTTPMVTLTPFGNLEIITHIPRNAQTAAAFHQLAMDTPATAHRLSSWPEK